MLLPTVSIATGEAVVLDVGDQVVLGNARVVDGATGVEYDLYPQEGDAPPWSVRLPRTLNPGALLARASVLTC